MGKSKTPGLLDKLEAAAVAHKKKLGPKCVVCALPDDVQDWIAQALISGKFSQAAIAAALRTNGHAIGDHSISNHTRMHRVDK